jgi:hypothetical protein
VIIEKIVANEIFEDKQNFSFQAGAGDVAGENA